MELVIYKAVNLKNGKIYIGRTNNFKKRVGEHLRSKSNFCFSRAINKYGKDNFIFEIIHVAKNNTELSQLEEFYINKYNSIVPSGYNQISYNSGRYITDDKTSLKIRNSHLLKKERSSGYFGVSHENRTCDMYNAKINYRGIKYCKLFYDKIKAAEAYDRMSLYFYGDDVKLNFPEKINEYGIGLKEFAKWFMVPRKKSSQYIGVSFLKDTNRWVCYIFHNKKMLTLGFYKNEIEAAEIRDKITLLLYPNRPLNFPENYKNYLKEDLKDLYKKCLTRYIPASKEPGVSFNNRVKKWMLRFWIDKKPTYWGKYPTEQDAINAKKLVLNFVSKGIMPKMEDIKKKILNKD